MSQSVLKPAMSKGLYLGLLFSINFLLFASGEVYFVLIMMIIIITTTSRFTARYRDVVCEGKITYAKAFSFVIFAFFFASLISSLVKYIYCQYFDPSFLERMVQESMKMFQLNGIEFDKTMYEQLAGTKPATFAIEFIWDNILMGTFLATIVALFIKKDNTTAIQ